MFLRKLALLVGVCVEVNVIVSYEWLNPFLSGVLIGVGGVLITEAVLEGDG